MDATVTTVYTNVVNVAHDAEVLDLQAQEEDIRRLLRDVPNPIGAASEILSFLTMLKERERHVESLAGPPLLIEAEALAQAFAANFHRHVFRSVPMMSGRTVADVLGPVDDQRGFLKRLRDSSTAIALRSGNTFVYPAFQFDADQRQPHDVVARVNRRLNARQDPWGTLAWWLAENPRWGHRRPIDHSDDPVLVDLVEALQDDGY